MNLKSSYVGASRRVRSGLAGAGLLSRLDAWSSRSDGGKWARSLLSIYDLEDLAALDVPWWTLSSAAEVAAFLRGRRDARVFEWGSGSSTLWLSKRAGTVTSVEHDQQWADQVAALVPDNVALRCIPPGPPGGRPTTPSAKAGFEGLDFSAYVSAIDAEPGAFDLIVVDGRAREACLERAVRRLSPGGMIVFDNVDRRRYREAIDEFGDAVTTRITRGLTPCLPYPTRTALITVRDS